MKTIILENPGSFRAATTAEPAAPGPGEALVRVRSVGICGTDLHAFRGRQPFFTYPRILGHELGVEVLAVGEGVTQVKPGRRGAVEPYLNCGMCIACRRGKPNCCASLKVLGVHTDGGMRERIVVPASKLHVSDKLTLDQLALVETLGIGAHAVDRAALAAEETVLVVGAGPIGLSVVPFAKLGGARVAVMDVNPGRLEFCKAQLHADETILLAPGAEPAELVRARLGDLPVAVFDATGNPASMNGAFKLVAPGGRLVFISLVQADITFHDPEFHRKELTLLSTRNSRPDDFRRIIRLLEAGRIDTRPWITHRVQAEGMIDALPAWLDPASGVIKAMVEF